MSKNNQSIRSKKVGGAAAIGLCCVAIFGLSVATGSNVYASAAQQHKSLANMHEERMLARTIDGDMSTDEWDWEAPDEAETKLP